MMNEDESEEALCARIQAAWDNLPMPPEDFMKIARKRAGNKALWQEHGYEVFEEFKFDGTTYEQRLQIQVTVYKLLARDPNPN